MWLLVVSVFGHHGLLEALDRVVQLVLACLRVLLVAHGLGVLGLVDALELTVLAGQLALLILQQLDLLFFLVGALLELGLLGQGVVEAGIEHVDVLLALLGLGLGLLQAVLEVLQVCGLLVTGVVVAGAGVGIGGPLHGRTRRDGRAIDACADGASPRHAGARCFRRRAGGGSRRG